MSVDKESTEAAKMSRLTKRDFKTFSNPTPDKVAMQEAALYRGGAAKRSGSRR
jgi:hypothetical protein